MATPSSPSSRPPVIGVFDSGFGGLTVLRALLPMFPGAHFVYLGDTARLPYGAKSQATIARYAVSAGAFLLAQGAQALVVACNTASALALDDLKAALPIPVVGVIAPGTEAARALIANPAPAGEPQVLVLATSATVQSGAYRHALAALGVPAYEQACPLLVPLVEEGWIDHPVTAEVLRIYLADALQAAPRAEVLVLGCTHYPLLEPLIQRTLTAMNRPLQLVDSAHAAALATAAMVAPSASTQPATCSFFATDSIAKFSRLGASFLGRPVTDVQLVDLGG